MLNLILIFLARYFIYAVIFLTVILVVRDSKRASFILFGLVTSALAFLLSRVASRLYYNSRPFVDGGFTPLIPHLPDNGFPSDHTLLAAVCAVVIYKLNPKWGIVFWAFALIIGLARVFSGVHHLIDIVASLLIALLAGFSVYVILKPRSFKGSLNP